MNKMLQYQSERIEIALWSHGLKGIHVVAGTVGPRWVRYALTLPWGVRPAAVIRLADDLANRLGSSVRVAQDMNGQLYVEIPRESSHSISLARIIVAFRDKSPGLAAALGVAIDGQPVFLHLPAPDVAHVLIAGTTGSGKTVLARAIALSLAAFNSPAQLQLLLVDPKGSKFKDLNALPHLLANVITEADHARHVLGELETVMIERDRGRIATPHIVAIIDELADLVLSHPDILQPITRLVQRGREAGVHLVGCVQKPTVEVLGSLSKANFPVRLVGSVTTPEEAKIASGIAGSGAEKLLGRGDFLLITQGSVQFRFQAPNASPAAARTIIKNIQARLPDQVSTRRQERWQPPDLRVVVDNRGIEADARRVLRTPGWLDQWWDVDNQRFKYGHLTAIGAIVGREPAGAGYRYANQVSEKLMELLVSRTSESSTTTPGAGIFMEKDKNASTQG